MGQWLFTLISTTPTESCGYRIYQKARHLQGDRQVEYDLFYAFAPTINTDGPLYQPIQGTEDL